MYPGDSQSWLNIHYFIVIYKHSVNLGFNIIKCIMSVIMPVVFLFFCFVVFWPQISIEPFALFITVFAIMCYTAMFH